MCRKVSLLDRPYLGGPAVVPHHLDHGKGDISVHEGREAVLLLIGGVDLYGVGDQKSRLLFRYVEYRLDRDGQLCTHNDV